MSDNNTTTAATTLPYPEQGADSTAAAAGRPLVNIRDLNIHVGAEHLLKDVSVGVKRGAFVGIIGESGAGKTTLLRLLARRVQLGTIDYTGYGWIHDNIWLIAQENVLYEYDTPWDLVTYIHALRFPDADAAAREAEATDALKSVELPKHLWRAAIGSPDTGLSVGARRLLNVAMAVVAHAELILLDEPTTGLDPPTAHQVVSVVRRLCNDSCACVCTIHQPNAATFDLFTDILVMFHGRAYRPEYVKGYGGDAESDVPSPSMEPFSVKEEKAEELPKVVPPSPGFYAKKKSAPAPTPSQLQALNAAEQAHMTPAARLLAAAAAGWLLPSVPIDEPTEELHLEGTLPQKRFVGIGKEIGLLLNRSTTRVWRNVFAFRFRVMVSIGLALLLGVCFIQLSYTDASMLRDWTGFFFCINGISFVPLIISAGFFPDEKPSFINEFNQSLRPGVVSYMVARTVLDVVVALVLSTSGFIAAGMIGIDGRWGQFYFTMVMQTLVADSLGFMSSIRLPPELVITAVVPGIGFLSCLLGATLLSPTGDSAILYDILKWVSFFKYSIAAMANEQLSLMSGSCTVGVDSGCQYADAQAARSFMELDGDGFEFTTGFQWMMLAIMFVVLRVGAAALLVTLVDHGRVVYSTGAAAGGLYDYRRPKFIRMIRSVVVKLNSPAFPGEDGVLNADLAAANPEKRPLIVRSGEVVCVLGPTHSAKSLILQCIAGHVPIVGGTDVVDAPAYHIAANGERVRRPALEHRASVRVAYQHDDFLFGMTVGSILQFNIAVRENRAGREIPSEDALATEAMSVLELVRLVVPRTRPCKALSGGQQRRLSLACQIVHRPATLVLDEPTSGLDSEMSVAIMKNVIAYAREWRTVVVCSMQQPDARLTSLMDHVIMMESQAKCQAITYRDPATVPEDREPHWERRVAFAGTLAQSYECPDMAVFAELPQRGVTAEDLCGLAPADDFDEDAFEATIPAADFDPDVRASMGRSVINVLRMFRLQLHRNITNRLTTPWWYLLEITVKFMTMPFILAIMIPRIDDPTYANRIAAFFISTAAMMFSGLVGPCVIAAFERLIYLRETRSGDYGAISHACARWLCELPFDTIGITAGVLVLHQAVGFSAGFGIVWVITVMCYQAALSIGTMCALLPMPLAVTAGLATFCIVGFMLMSDVMVTPGQLKRTGIMMVMEYVVTLRHGVALFLNAELEGQPAVVKAAVKRAWGMDRRIDDDDVSWALLFASSFAFRFMAVAVAWFLLRLGNRAPQPIDDAAGAVPEAAAGGDDFAIGPLDGSAAAAAAAVSNENEPVAATESTNAAVSPEKIEVSAEGATASGNVATGSIDDA